MENQELKVKVSSDIKTLEILTGNALPRKEPLRVDIKGLINAPHEFMLKREPDPFCSHLIVDVSKGTLKLVIDEKNQYKDEIKGSLNWIRISWNLVSIRENNTTPSHLRISLK